MKVICKTTPFIALSSIDQIGLLKEIYSSFITPGAVIEEVSAGGAICVPDLASIDWIEVVPNVSAVENRKLFQLDYGERQVMLNALELKANLVLIDDRNARTSELLRLRVNSRSDSFAFVTQLQKKITSFISAGRRILMDHFCPESNPDNKSPQNPVHPVK